MGDAQTSLSIYWGSIDADEAGTRAVAISTFAITVDGYTLTGADLVTMYGAHGDRLLRPILWANQWVTITGLGAFTTAEFTSTRNAFEFSLGCCGSGAVDLGDDGLGFAGLGYAAFRRNSKGQMAVSAI